ncbi:Rhodanese-like protein [Aulographum hederae CBS 113979]|uniref:Rhodanese-like protein n=1 Tax=Aulographum hederae CBS 113979 TaxID=1176131 RepID=A0A6G1GMA4_9PEZI|nr:Rhodanese-like protein [Aulographum hederae CBS 113979]
MSQSYFPSFLLTPKDLEKLLSENAPSPVSTAPRVIPLCASWFLPNDGRTGYETFVASRVPSARFFDLDAVKDPNSPYPHMLPSPKDFAAAMGKLGIRSDDNVVVYDTKELGIFSAPRVAWTLKVFGHPNVAILNNFKLWSEGGFPVEEGEPKKFEEVEYRTPELSAEKVASFEDVKEKAQEMSKHLEGAEQVQILDARSPGRFQGVEPEPREGLSSGHIPNSINIPVGALLDSKTQAFLPGDTLKALFESKGVDPARPIISSCGTGVTAAVIDAALTEAGYAEDERRIYDGSWTEWAQRVEPEEGLIVKKT